MGTGASVSRDTFPYQMVVFIVLLLLLPHVACKGTVGKCLTNDGLPVPHEWYQPGDFLIGGITSQVLYMFHKLSFEEHPSQKLFDIPVEIDNRSKNKCFGVSEKQKEQMYWIDSATFESNGTLKTNQISKALESLFAQHGLCSAFVQRIPRQTYLTDMYEINDMVSTIRRPAADAKVNTCVLHGETFSILWLSYFILLGAPGHKGNASVGKLWIMTAQIDFALTSLQSLSDLQVFQGAISFMLHSSELPGYQHFLQLIKPCWTERDRFLQSFWEQAFNCFYPNCSMPMKDDGTCTGEERLENLPGPLFEMHMTGHSYSIYNAVYTVAHALHGMCSSRYNHRGLLGGKKDNLRDLHPWKVRPP
ncbi:UNVERIFIED_CONTAM: hypothetical protein K2H54_043782 [Gekko kuhli]